MSFGVGECSARISFWIGEKGPEIGWTPWIGMISALLRIFLGKELGCILKSFFLASC